MRSTAITPGDSGDVAGYPGGTTTFFRDKSRTAPALISTGVPGRRATPMVERAGGNFGKYSFQTRFSSASSVDPVR